jgi:acylphosphatase
MYEVHYETVLFSGRVQGVGFRYTTLQIAKEFEVAGWVKNLPDGRVHLEAEGAPATVKAFVSAVEDRLHGYIRKTERKTAQRLSHFSGFTIR